MLVGLLFLLFCLTEFGCAANRLAYAFYATSNKHLCAVLVNVLALKQSNSSSSIGFVLVYPSNVSLSPMQLERARKSGIDLREVEPLEGPPSTTDTFEQGVQNYYNNVFTKLRIFQLYDYDRLVYLDADAIVFRNLDHLFFLPDVFLAAPRAYWLTQPQFTSMLMVIKPSSRTWTRIKRHLPPEQRMYDMDILNTEFKDEILVLPNEYALLNNLWDRTDLSIGYKFGPKYSKLEKEAFFVHFSLLGKPWNFPKVDHSLRPSAKPFFWSLYVRWWQLNNQSGCSWDAP